MGINLNDSFDMGRLDVYETDVMVRLLEANFLDDGEEMTDSEEEQLLDFETRIHTYQKHRMRLYAQAFEQVDRWLYQAYERDKLTPKQCMENIRGLKESVYLKRLAIEEKFIHLKELDAELDYDDFNQEHYLSSMEERTGYRGLEDDEELDDDWYLIE